MRDSHTPLPPGTRAFFCAHCGAVSLSAIDICEVRGQGTRADWCGTGSIEPPDSCRNRKNNRRYRCSRCGQVAMNPELLCLPEEMREP